MLTSATVVLAALVALLIALGWVFASGWNAATARESLTVDALAIVTQVAPAVLVGWCAGLATSEVVARGEALGARVAGLVAGAVGIVAGVAVLALGGTP